LDVSIIQGLFQKFHRELCLLLLVLFGLSCGQLAATLAGVVLRPDTSLEATSRPTSRATSVQISDHDLNRILQQNIFDPTARGSRSAPIKPSRTDITSQTSPRKDLTLIGTLVSGADSTALLGVGKEIKLFHLDDPLSDGGRVETILRNRVTIRNRDGSATELTLREEAQRKTRPTAGSMVGGGIRSAGENRWTVSRATADAARTNIGEQLRLAQMEPRIINGRTDGFLVSKLSPKSMLTKMGIRRGDVILQVNKMPIDSPEKALQILQQLREARQLTVDLERKDKPMTFSYEIN
jgi:general secretion pathway protein C